MKKNDVVVGLRMDVSVENQPLDSHHFFVKKGDSVRFNVDVGKIYSNKEIVLLIDVDDIDINHTWNCSCGDTQPPDHKPKTPVCKPECISCENANFRPKIDYTGSKIELAFKCKNAKCVYSEAPVCDVCGDTITKIEMLSTLMLCNKSLCASCYRDAREGNVSEK